MLQMGTQSESKASQGLFFNKPHTAVGGCKNIETKRLNRLPQNMKFYCLRLTLN